MVMMVMKMKNKILNLFKILRPIILVIQKLKEKEIICPLQVKFIKMKFKILVQMLKIKRLI